MRVNELLQASKRQGRKFTNLHEWQEEVSQLPRFSRVREDAYDADILQAFDSSGSVVGYFNQCEMFGEITRR